MAKRPGSAEDADYVGRAQVRELMGDALRACRDGRGGVLVLEGEAGAGKTRSLDLLEQMAGSLGVRTARGRASEVRGAPPLLPWSQVLEALAEPPPDLDAPELVPEDDRARFRLFRALADRLLAAAQTAPTLVALDDLQAADLASLRLLAFLAAEDPGAALLLGVAWRHTDVPRGDPRGALLEDVSRRARVVRLEGLEEEDVARLVASVGQTSVHGDVVRAVFERSLGNPLFAKQLVELLLAKGCNLADTATAAEAQRLAPAGVRPVLRGRLERLGRGPLAALRLATAFGREFDGDLLAAACAALPPELREDLADIDPAEALDSASAARIVEETPELPGRWRFAHVLFRDVLYDAQPSAARRRLHRAAARAILDRRDPGEDPWLTAAAHHLVHALDPETARPTYDLARRAGERALARCAQEDAVAWFEAAWRALDLEPAPADREADRLALYLRLGAARWRCGQANAARRDFARAVELARARGDDASLAEAAVGLAGRTDAVLGPEDEARALLEEALAALDDTPTRLRVDVQTRLASALYFSTDEEGRERVSLEAVACAEALGDPAALVYALTARHYVLSRPGNLDERERVNARALRILKGRPDDSAIAIARFQAVLNGLERGDFGRVDEQLDAHGALAARLREPFVRWQQAALRATRALARGDHRRGEALALRARELGEEAESPNAFAMFAGHLYGARRAQGRLGELEPVLADLASRFPHVPGYGFARAEAGLALGREAEARAFLAAAGSQGFQDLPRDFNWPSLMSIATRCVEGIGSAELAWPLYRALLPAEGTCIVMPFGSLWDGAVSLYLGRLATLLGRREDARRHLAAAAERHARIGVRPFLADTWLAQSRLHAHLGERSEAARRAGEAASLYRALRMPEAEKRAEALTRPSAPEGAGAPAVHRLVRNGARWRARYGAEEARLPHSLGMVYLARLLAQPGEPVHVLDLTARRAAAGASDSGAVLDARARAEVRRRIRELRDELEEAEERADLGAREGLRAELEALEEELARALGLGGRARRLGDPAERARKSVYNRIQTALARIEPELPELAEHLRHSLRTGRTCVYAPERSVRWVVEA